MRGAAARAYQEFAAARTGHLFRSACLLTGGDTYLAEDLVQETLGRLYVAWGRMSEVDNPAGYAQTTLVRMFLSHQRRRSNRERPAAELPDHVARDADGDAALRVVLLAALAALGPKDRAVLILRYWEDRSVEETAAVMRATAGAVRARSTRALTQLRRHLSDSRADLTTG